MPNLPFNSGVYSGNYFKCQYLLMLSFLPFSFHIFQTEWIYELMQFHSAKKSVFFFLKLIPIT